MDIGNFMNSIYKSLIMHCYWFFVGLWLEGRKVAMLEIPGTLLGTWPLGVLEIGP